MGRNIDTNFENRGFNSWHDKKNEKILKILFLGEVEFGVELVFPIVIQSLFKGLIKCINRAKHLCHHGETLPW